MKLEEGCHSGKSGKRRRRAKAGDNPHGFFMVEEAKDFRAVGTATVSVKVWEQKAKEKQMSNVVAPLPLPSHFVSCCKTAEGKKFKPCMLKERIVSDLFIYWGQGGNK